MPALVMRCTIVRATHLQCRQEAVATYERPQAHTPSNRLRPYGESQQQHSSMPRLSQATTIGTTGQPAMVTCRAQVSQPSCLLRLPSGPAAAPAP
jgi:hypothetical protein